MKELIVGIFMMMILLIFPLQNMRDTIINHSLDEFDLAVHNSAQVARTDGCSTTTNINNLKTKLTALFPDSASSIVINVTIDPKYRREAYSTTDHIDYDISVTVKNVILMGDYLGISASANQFTYRKKGFVLSERIP
jgi:hypothetical protein